MVASVSWSAPYDREFLERFYSLTEAESPSGEGAAIRTLLQDIPGSLIGKGETDDAGNLKFFLPAPIRLFSANMET